MKSTTQYDGNTVVSWADVGWKPREVTTEKPKLSALVRDLGYGNYMNYSDCVVGRAYRSATGGRELSKDAYDSGYIDKGHRFYINAFAADYFGIPHDVCLEAEQMCYGRRHTQAQIADYLQSKGY